MVYSAENEKLRLLRSFLTYLHRAEPVTAQITPTAHSNR